MNQIIRFGEGVEGDEWGVGVVSRTDGYEFYRHERRTSTSLPMIYHPQQYAGDEYSTPIQLQLRPDHAVADGTPCQLNGTLPESTSSVYCHAFHAISTICL